MPVVVYGRREVLLTDRGETRLHSAEVRGRLQSAAGRESGTDRGMTGVGMRWTVSLKRSEVRLKTRDRLAADPSQFMHSPA